MGRSTRKKPQVAPPSRRPLNTPSSTTRRQGMVRGPRPGSRPGSRPGPRAQLTTEARENPYEDIRGEKEIQEMWFRSYPVIQQMMTSRRRGLQIFNNNVSFILVIASGHRVEDNMKCPANMAIVHASENAMKGHKQQGDQIVPFVEETLGPKGDSFIKYIHNQLIERESGPIQYSTFHEELNNYELSTMGLTGKGVFDVTESVEQRAGYKKYKKLAYFDRLLKQGTTLRTLCEQLQDPNSPPPGIKGYSKDLLFVFVLICESPDPRSAFSRRAIMFNAHPSRNRGALPNNNSNNGSRVSEKPRE